MTWALIVWTCLQYMEPQCTVVKSYWKTEQECAKAKKSYLEKRDKPLPLDRRVVFCQKQTAAHR